MGSELDIFSPQYVQHGVEGVLKREYAPLSALQQGAPIEFAITGAPGQYLDMAKSYLHIRAKITKADGTKPAAEAQVGPVNLTLHSMFSSVEVTLGGKMISDNNGMYAQRSYLETLLTMPQEVQENQLGGAGWAKDTAAQIKDLNCTGAGAVNLGLKKRAEGWVGGAEVELIDRLHLDICHQSKLILDKCDMRIKLIPSRDSFVLLNATAVTREAPQEQFKMVITHARF